MRLNTHVEAEKTFAKWQLEVGHGKHTDETGSITLPNHFKCPENTLNSLIEAIYPGITQLPLPSDEYFANRTILTSQNTDVDEINEQMLDEFPGEEKDFMSADSIKGNGEYGMARVLPAAFPRSYYLIHSVSCNPKNVKK